MSYLDRAQDPRRRTTALAGALVIQSVIGLVLVTGLAIRFVDPVEPPPLTGTQIPLPPPPPAPDPSPTPTSAAAITDPVAPKPPLPLAPNSGAQVDEFDPSKDITDIVIPRISRDPLPDAAPTSRPSFAPKSAAPRNDPNGWVQTDDYPSRDIREGNEGTTFFRLVIGGNGKVTDCRITRSSGHPGLDAATCRNVVRRARFDPASDGKGDKVAGTYSSSVRWELPRR
jgi:protein TonB